MVHLFYTRPGESEHLLGLFDVHGNIDAQRLRMSVPQHLVVDSAYLAEGEYQAGKWVEGKRLHTFFEGGSLASSSINEFVA